MQTDKYFIGKATFSFPAKKTRAINGKLVRSHVIGHHARCFRGWQLPPQVRKYVLRFFGFSYVLWKPRNEQIAKMGSFRQSKRLDNKRYTVEVRWGIFFLRIWRIFLFLRAVVNIPIQTLIIPPWLLLRKMIISQLELRPPVIW